MEVVASASLTIDTTVIREILTASRTYYVRTDGNDSNDGLTNNAAGAFLTIQHAINVVSATLDVNTQTVIIQVADGAYPAALTLRPCLTSTRITLRGNVTTPANVTITLSTNHCISAPHAGQWQVEGFKLSTTSGNFFALNVLGFSDVRFESMDFGACTGAQVASTDGAIVRCNGPYSITGAATHHYYAGTHGSIILSGTSATLTGTPSFSVGFANAQHLGLLVVWTATFTGSATGSRYQVFANSVIATNGGGANFFPGSVAGSSGTGGQYLP